VDEVGGVQRVVVALVPQVAVGQPPQFFIDERHQMLKCLCIPIAPLQQQLGYFTL
jgi:hypothetical protein